MRILDVGCGTAKVRGAIGVDRVLLPDVDIVADLADPRYPFADDTFDEIHLNDVIEHLPDTIATMEAIYRIAKPDSKIVIRVVNWNCHYTAMDPTHLKAFTQNSFDFFGQHSRTYYSRARFDVVKCDLQYNGAVEKRLRGNKRLLKFLSNYLCNILEGLNFELRTRKPAGASLRSDDGTLRSILRCPHCASMRIRKNGAAAGTLRPAGESWLVCQEELCQRKYPVYDKDVPILLPKEAEQWARTPVESLPATLPQELDHVLPLPAEAAP